VSTRTPGFPGRRSSPPSAASNWCSSSRPSASAMGGEVRALRLRWDAAVRRASGRVSELLQTAGSVLATAWVPGSPDKTARET
jgi:hypothetical protein